MKKWIFLLISLLTLCVVSCGPTQANWQKQYDLGMQYLEDGDYEQAIVAFTAAIKIDPKQTSAYVGRADAYVEAEDMQDHITLAREDYEQAIVLDGTDATVYIRYADTYLKTEEYEKAEEIINRGREKLGDLDEFVEYEEKIIDLKPVTLSDTTKVKLEQVFMYLYCCRVGEGTDAHLDELSTDDLAYFAMMYLSDNYGGTDDIFSLCTDTIPDGNRGYAAVQEENLQKFFKDCFGADFSGYTYGTDAMSWLVKQGDLVYTYGGDWGISKPYTEISTYERVEKGQIVVTGTYGYEGPRMDEYGDIDPDSDEIVRTPEGSFTAILKNSDNTYLDGYTIESFRYGNEAETTANTEADGTLTENYRTFVQDVHDHSDKYVEETYGIEADTFAIADIDQDGIAEILVDFQNTYGYLWQCQIWKWNQNISWFEQINTVGTTPDCYKNGILVSPASHNHSYGQTVWPSELLKYNSSTGKYEHFGEISSSDPEFDPSGEKYSAADDADGDGVIYYFETNDMPERPLTEAEYQSYYNQYMPDNEKMELEWKNITQENIDQINL